MKTQRFWATGRPGPITILPQARFQTPVSGPSFRPQFQAQFQAQFQGGSKKKPVSGTVKNYKAVYIKKKYIYICMFIYL